MENIVSHFNFEESISIGVQRADVAATNKAEISEIFNEFSQAFQNASSGRVHSAIKSRQRKIYEKNHSMLAMAGMFNSNYNYENYKALVLSNNKKEFTIAEIIENEDGYPIRLKIQDDTSSYSDKDSLAEGLSRLASQTEVGKYFKLLLQDDD